MGVQGLWELLAPVGRRVSVETLAGKKLAIDASIWMIQFMKAMRDERGEMVKNAHLLGFFRRICKLLFLRTKPVFVFDGGTPALKRRTVIARRRQRENAQAKIRKTAEKLLLNHLKARKLEELVEIENKNHKDDSKGKQVISEDQADLTKNSSRSTGSERTETNNQEMVDELLAASLAAEEDGKFPGSASASASAIPFEEEDDMNDDEEMIFPVIQGKVDPTVLAALPPSMQLDLLVQMRERLMAENRQKYQKVKKAPSKFSELQIQAYLKTVAFRREIDEVQKSAAGRGVGGVPTSRIVSEANREFIFSSSFTGDKQALASSGVTKNGDPGHQAQEKYQTSLDSVNCNSSTVPLCSVTVAGIDDPERDSDHPVETYLDERGRVRVSRVRGMGIRMTRDLQWNLLMMEELEEQKRMESIDASESARCDAPSLGVRKNLPQNSNNMEISTAEEGNNESFIPRDGSHEESSVRSESAIEISFLENENDKINGDNDDLFMYLVAGSSGSGFSSENDRARGISLKKCGNEIRQLSNSDTGEERQPSLVEGSHVSDESEVDWEDGVCDIPTSASPSWNESEKAVSRGSLEEEADIREAVRRSLEDHVRGKANGLSSANVDLEVPSETASEAKMMGSPCQVPSLAKNGISFFSMPLKNDYSQSHVSGEAMDGPGKVYNVDTGDGLTMNDTSSHKLSTSIAREHKTDGKSMVVDEPLENGQASKVELLSQEITEDGSACIVTLSADQATSSGSMKVCRIGEDELLDPNNQMEKESSFTVSTKVSPQVSSHISVEMAIEVPDVVLVDAHTHDSQASVYHNCSSEMTENRGNLEEGSVMGAQASDMAGDRELFDGKDSDLLAQEEEHYKELNKMQDNLESQEMAGSKADLGEEMLLLRQEQLELRDEQRKLERNAESVTSEMFAECQELLQMFGLPYIIAPMEAEAQCAYLELKNLVDGIVTDDSDVFLFGSRSVYKNIFDDRKYVETYFMKDIESELGLTREKLIRMALLLGSDYTEGVSGIGIVNAIEVVHAFPEEDGLQKFREWIESPDPSILERVDAHSGKNSRKRQSKDSSNYADGPINAEEGSRFEESAPEGPDDQQSVNNITNLKQIFMEKHRNVSKNWHIPSSFPSHSVISAYVSPHVDDSTEPFSWGKPDLFVLRKLCWERFGWSNQKADELLVPVLKEYNKHETQLRLEAFYSFNERFAKIRSRRIQKAVKGITGKLSTELMMGIQKENSTSKKRKSSSPKEDTSLIENDAIGSKEPASKQPRRKRVKPQLLQSEAGQPETLIQNKGRGNGARGSARGRGRGRGKRKEGPSFEEAETNSSNSDDSNSEKEEQVEKTTDLPELRRSARPRKDVKYTAEDVDADGASSPSNHSNINVVNEEVVEQEPFPDDGAFNDKNQGGEPSAEDSGLDYLSSGGGFCLDEGDKSSEPVETVSNPAKAPDELFVDLDASEAKQRLDYERFSGNERDLHARNKEKCEGISQTPTVKETDQVDEQPMVQSQSNLGLRAMPSLRRRKKP